MTSPTLSPHGRWLDIQCRLVAGVREGVLFNGPGADRIAATWPLPAPAAASLVALVRQAVRADRAAVDAGADGDLLLAVPLRDATGTLGWVALCLAPRDDIQRRAVIRLLEWGSAWLALLDELQPASWPAAAAEAVAAALVDAASWREGTQRLADHLAAALQCRRVSVTSAAGSGRVQLCAVSGGRRVDARTDAARRLVEAAQAALDADTTLAGKAVQASRLGPVAPAQQAPVVVVPMANGSHQAVLVLERDPESDNGPAFIAEAESLARVAAPLLAFAWRADASLAQRSAIALQRWLGTAHPLRKATLLGLVTLLVASVLVPGTSSVKARAAVAGTVQRAIVAPRDGYLDAVHAVAGDQVEAGATLAVLAGETLQMERLKWLAERARLRKELQGALAVRDRARTRVLEAQAQAAEAELALVDYQLGQRQLTAPFAGLVVSGDHSQRLGAPVSEGEVLFEIVPGDDYRLVLDLPESRVHEVQAGQHGRVTLTAFPAESLDFEVTLVTPVSGVREGGNWFRAEARITGGHPPLHPGMRGVAKVHIDERPLAAIWTRELTDWLRLQWWSWFG